MARKRRYRRKDDISNIFGGLALLGASYYYYSGSINLKPVMLIIFLIAAILLGLYAYVKIKSIVKLKQSGIRDIDVMKGVEFENYLKYYFKDQGYKVKLTPATGDYGADLIIEKDGQKTAIQAKRYRDPVNLKAVQEVVGAIAHYGCSTGMVITNSVFQKSAWELAKTNNITLWDRKILINKLAEYQKQKNKNVSVS